jgi:putative FmdB family regulatory protein
MPLYEYQCSGCGLFEASQPMAQATAPVVCPACGKRSRRILSATAIAGPRRSGRRRGPVGPQLVEQGTQKDPPKAAPNVTTHGRPWMIGH